MEAKMLATYLPFLFTTYIVLAVGYNLVSLLLVEVTGKRAAPTDPVVGVMMMTVLYLIYATSPQVSKTLYIFFLISFILLVFRFGIITHIWATDRSLYFSEFTRYSAFAINIFGVATLLAIVVTSL